MYKGFSIYFDKPIQGCSPNDMLHPDLLDALERADGPPLIAYQAEGDLPRVEKGWHSHVRGQLFYVERGLFVSETRRGSWLLPPGRAGWLPPGAEHTVRITGPSRGWGLFVAPHMAHCLPDYACVVGVNDLMRSLVLRASSWNDQAELSDEQQRLMAVLVDEIRRAPEEPMHLPMPTDRRLQKMATTIIEHPDDSRGVDEWAQASGVSTRTLTRLFRDETGCSFTQWRQQAKLSRALEHLARGMRVSEVADALGYATVSAFVAMFRKAYGTPPGRYFAA